MLPTLTVLADHVTKPIQTYGLGEVQTVAMSPDGRHLATGGPSGAFLWDFAQATVRHRFEAHGGRVSALAFSPGGTTLLTAGDDRLIRSWDVASGAAIHTYAGHQGEILNLAFAPDGNSFASASADNTARVWSLAEGALLHQVRVPGAYIQAAVFTPDGSGLVTAATAQTNLIRLWDLASETTVRTFPDHGWQVAALGFVAGGHLVSAGDDRVVRVWDVESGEEVHALAGATQSIAGLIATPDRSTIVAGCQDGRVIAWDAATGARLHQNQSEPLQAMCAIPSTDLVLLAGPDNALRVFDLETGQTRRTLTGHSTSVTLGVAFSPDGEHVLSGGVEASTRLWDRANGQLARTFDGHGGGTAVASFSTDGTRVLTTRGAPQPAAQLWNTATGALEREFKWAKGWPMAAALSRDDSRLATGAQDGLLRIWDVASGKTVSTWTSPSAWVTVVAFSPDGKRLASGGTSIQPVATLWDVESGQILHQFELEAGSVKVVAFSHDGSELLVGWEDGILRRFDTASGGLMGEIVTPAAFLNAAVYSPNDAWILTGEGWPSFTATLWDAASGEQLRVFAGHKGPVDSVAFDSAGTQILTGADTVRRWDLADLAARLRHSRTVEGLELRWSMGTLESAGDLRGPWRPVEGATSPWRVPADGSALFHRVVIPGEPQWVGRQK